MADLELSFEQNIMRGMCADKVAFPLFVAGYGSGKSFILVHNAAQDVMSFRGCKVGIYAPTYDLLELNLVPAFEQYFDNIGIAHSYNRSKHIMHLPGERKLIFRSLADEKRIVAYEVYTSHVDEADLMAMDKAAVVWDRVIGRNRQHHPKYGRDTKITIAAYSTPESYRFTYNRWKKNPGDGYQHVVAPTWSNETISIPYVKGLISSYTPEQQRAYLSGLWTNLTSGNVYSYFDTQRHDTARTIKPGDVLHIGQDFNYGGCCGAVFVIDRDPTFRVSQIDEYADVTTEDVVETLQSRYKGHRCILYPDSTGDHGSSNASQSDIAILKRAGYEVKADSPPRIQNRVNAVQRLFHNDLLYINQQMCPNSWSSRIEHAYNKLTGKPDKFVGPGTVDDWNDAGDYPLEKLFPIRATLPISRVAQ